jgi:hypothetical protein
MNCPYCKTELEETTARLAAALDCAKGVSPKAALWLLWEGEGRRPEPHPLNSAEDRPILVCPECEACVLPGNAEAPHWTCAACSAQVPGEHAICWQCGAEAPGSAEPESSGSGDEQP